MSLSKENFLTTGTSLFISEQHASSLVTTLDDPEVLEFRSSCKSCNVGKENESVPKNRIFNCLRSVNVTLVLKQERGVLDFKLSKSLLINNILAYAML